MKKSQISDLTTNNKPYELLSDHLNLHMMNRKVGGASRLTCDVCYSPRLSTLDLTDANLLNVSNNPVFTPASPGQPRLLINC